MLESSINENSRKAARGSRHVGSQDHLGQAELRAIVQGRSQQEKRTGAPVVPSKNAGHVADGTHQTARALF